MVFKQIMHCCAVSSRYQAMSFAASKQNYDVHVTTDIHKDVVAGQRVRAYDVTN
jgi:hypothetical protein